MTVNPHDQRLVEIQFVAEDSIDHVELLQVPEAIITILRTYITNGTLPKALRKHFLQLASEELSFEQVQNERDLEALPIRFYS
jgi:hypothetical protein